VKNRLIGKYIGEKPGPLLVITAAMHGNEPAGIKALDLLFKMLEVEPITNPQFVYKGSIIGIIGNYEAYQKGQRYIHKDINRCWQKDHIAKLKVVDKSTLLGEDLEIKEILEIIDNELDIIKPERLYLLDLHTTSSQGIFCIATNDKKSIEIANDVFAPVILGLLHGIDGTTLHYFTEENFGIPTTAIAFEGGHHEDPQSVNRCIAATINFMRSIGVINADDVANRHDQILKEYAKGLPKLVEVFYKYTIKENEKWEMKPGFKNFDIIHQGDLLATYDGKPVYAQYDGYLLMPLYQKQGSDGFFIAKQVYSI
jgi:succinylglutamate desuccinylase